MTVEDDELRRALDQFAAIRSDVAPGAFVSPKGTTAGERVLDDNLRSGRLHWRAAGREARSGLTALDRGDRDLAATFLRHAREFSAAAMAAQLGAAGLADLATSAKPRGRRSDPVTAARDRRLAEAVEAQEARGVTGTAAITAALRADPELREAFRGLKPDGVARALERGRADAARFRPT